MAIKRPDKRFEVFRRRTIGSDSNPYMIRYILLRTPWFSIFLHHFLRSDHDRSLHDHPWSFLSILLWRGYIEHTESGAKRYYPGQAIYRPATWRHRVELVGGKPAWTLVLVGCRTRFWGFWPNGKWCWWRKYNPELAICEDHVISEGGND